MRDLGDVVLLPGLVNAHTHLEFSHLGQPLGRPGMPLVEWLPLAIAERQRRGTSAAETRSPPACRKASLAGTCAIGEIATADATATAYRTKFAVESPSFWKSSASRAPGGIGIRGGRERSWPRRTERRHGRAASVPMHPTPCRPNCWASWLAWPASSSSARGDAPGGKSPRSSSCSPTGTGSVSRFARRAQHVGPGGDSARQPAARLLAAAGRRAARPW